jgi:hypothetical protein
MLRPVSFSLPSSTELRVVFNDKLSESLNKNNFLIESVSGNIGGLSVRRTEVFDNYVIITTSPQVAGNFYTLYLKDAEDSRFMSDSGVPLVNDDVSRALFFVGLKKYNPARDRMYYNVPKTYNLENSNINNIISVQAEEVFQAQKDLGKVLSNNYISASVDNERRTRSSGATDRLLNEGVYKVSRVAKERNGQLIFRRLNYSADSGISRHSEVPNYPISLQEIYVEEEEVSLGSTDSSFEGFLLNLPNNNVIKVVKVTHIKADDSEDCYGDIGAQYSINTCKYSLLTNKYDPVYAFEDSSLNSNQVLLSAFGNIDEPILGDKIIISYLYKDQGIRVNRESIEAYNIVNVESESVPTNIVRFFLENAPVVNSYNEIPERDGVSFLSNRNSSGLPEAFLRELVFNSSKLPSEPGEYAINYATGEVIVAGIDEVGQGTGSTPVLASYLHRNVFSNNLDYYIEDDDIIAAGSRSMAGESVSIDLNYEKIYVEGVDYIAPCHTEVFNEHVENNFESAFVVRAKNTPVTDVHRIFNQTTGEIYRPLYHTSDEIHFSGKRSPEIKTERNEAAQFMKTDGEGQSPSGDFVCPSFFMKIKANASNSNISFSPGIPSELISENSTDYFVRSTGLLGGDEVSDLQVRFFGQPDSNGLINSFALSATASAPSLGEEVTLGTRVLRFELENELILSKSLDSVGSYVNSSVKLDDKSMFKREKYFEHMTNPANLRDSEDASIIKTVYEGNSEIFFENISRLRRVGDYCVDHYNGTIYVAVGAKKDYSPIKLGYSYGKIDNFNKNIISLTGAYKKITSADSELSANIVYNNLINAAEYSSITDLELSLVLQQDGVISLDLDANMKETCTVLSDYTVLSPHIISETRGVYDIALISGSNLSSANLDNRVEDIASDLAKKTVLNGGANLFDRKNMSYSENVIDLKIHKRIRARSKDDKLIVSVEDKDFGGIYEIRHVKTGEVVFDEKLNIDKIPGLDIVFSNLVTDEEAYIDIRSGINLSVIDDEDFVLDSSGNRFEIISADTVLSRIFVRSPAVNNVEAKYPVLGDAKVVVKATVEYHEDGVDIIMPNDSFVGSGDIIALSYVQGFIPSPNTKVAIDCSHGSVYINYLYVYDDVYVSYEYGDNEIDWSISNEINEGEEYYVSYKYGASRKALRDNFGVLTKIPYFQRFPLEADREVYRDGLQGVMNAFSNGAMKPSFETLVESFTDIKPNIEEAFFGSWILGRDNLTPEEIRAKGALAFRPCKFSEGIYIDKDTVVSAPALSNLNLDEGTASAWVSPDWAGIDNDATLTVDIDNFGIKEYIYSLGDNIFDYGSGFTTFGSEDAIGSIDLTGESITIHNFTHLWTNDDKEDEDVQIGAFAIKNIEDSVDRAVKTELDVLLRVSDFSAPENITPPRRKPSEDLAESRRKIGLAGLGRSLSDASGGLINAGQELESIRFCSPAFISYGDEHKLFMAMLNMVPVINNNSGRIYTFRVGDEHVTTNDVVKYDRPHVTRNCFCSVDNTLAELSGFRDKDLHTIKVELDFEIDLSYIEGITSFLDKKASTFRVLDTTGSIYEVYALIGADGEAYSNSIPDKITGFHINRIPQNKKYITAMGSEVINSITPVGEITLLYQTMSILTNGAKDSKKYLGYEAKNYMLDWMSDYVNFNIIRDPIENIVTLNIDNKDRTNKRTISLFYSDLIYADQEHSVFSHLNLDKWFNVADGRTSIDNAKSLSKGLAIGTLDRTSASTVDIQGLSYKIHNRYSVDDIYIGAAARNPLKLPFSINKADPSNASNGIPYNADLKEGIFIGYDNTCRSPLSDESGQWVFRSRPADSISAPVSVIGEGAGGFIFEYEQVPLKNVFSGKITTDGEFSSIVRSHRTETGFGCPVDVSCSASYRYCGEGLLESRENGWVKLEESNSSLINILIGGQEGQRSNWMRHGAFSTSANDGIYRMGESVAAVDNDKHNVSDGNFIYTRLPCYDGNYEATVGFKVSSLDYIASGGGGLGSFSGIISGYLTGISPIHIYDENINLKLALARSYYNQPLLVMLNGETNDVVDISYFDWEDLADCYLTVRKDSETGSLTVLSNDSVLSRLSTEDVAADSSAGCSFLNEPFFAIHLFDSSSSDIEVFHKKASGNILDISLIEFNGTSNDVDYSLEDNDIFITTDSKIEFSFKNIPLETFDEDGYQDGYLDAYEYVEDTSDGYVESAKEYDIDEICFTSDKLRYLLDTGEDVGRNRLSVFKDGKGFLNFRIIDSPRSLAKSSSVYNIATSIKHFKPGELHHIAASWRLNTLYEKDEMHLFVDGLEAPNLYRFGGPAKIRVNDRFSDVSKEVLQDFLIDDVEYGQTFTDGIVLAGTSKFISNSAGFEESMIGRSVVLLNSDIAQSYIGGEYIINSVNGNEVTFVSGKNLDIVTFNVSASDVSFAFPPTAGLKRRINTDLKNSKIAVCRRSCDQKDAELGGIHYYVDKGEVVIISGGDIINPSYRVNVDTRVIEFVGKDGVCKYTSSVKFSDLDIHIKTFGLKFALFNEKINLSSSSYFGLDNISNDPNSGKSVFLNHAAEPVSIEDVNIRRIILDRMIPETFNSYSFDDIKAEFEINLEKETGSHKLTSEPGRVHNTNLGRYLEIKFDSDNVEFCNDEDGYIDAYSSEEKRNWIRVIGETVDGSNFEEFAVRGNGAIRGSKLFLEVDQIIGSVSVADPDYEPFVIEVLEADPITTTNNSGEYAEIFRYVNGSFILTTAGSNGFYPFELHPGNYMVKYPAHLRANVPRVGERLYIGCDMGESGQFGGVIDELRVITEMSSDTRPTQRATLGTRSITGDFYNPNPLCSDDQTLLLAHFDDPIREQSRRLRQKEFLNEAGNFKYKLDLYDREDLLSVVNNKDKFESKMIRMGFGRDMAKRVFTEVHHAQGGPIFNEARFGRSDEMLVSSTSVNSSFGISAKFFDTLPLIISNRLSFFRKDAGTIEMWVSPLLSTLTDTEDRYFLDIYSVTKKRVTSIAPNSIELPTPAKKILKVELLQGSSEFSEFMLEADADKVFLDEVYRSKVTGRLTGGTGVEKDFSTGCRLSPDGRRVTLQHALPGSSVDVVVSYVPVDSSGERVSIYKNKKSQLVFSIESDGKVNSVVKDIDWGRNSWHRIACTYKANSSSDYMRMFVDGDDCTFSTYGDKGLLYGSGAMFGQEPNYDSSLTSIKISLGDDFRAISVGADIFGEHSALSRMDNIRLSRVARVMPQDPSGEYIDGNYSPNIKTVIPVLRDDVTTMLVNFEKESNEDSYAMVVDPSSGIFNFDIEVLDYFGKINDEVIEDLIVQLVDRLKPAHTNAVVVFPRESC